MTTSERERLTALLTRWRVDATLANADTELPGVEPKEAWAYMAECSALRRCADELAGLLASAPAAEAQALRNIRLRATAGRAFGHQSTPQSLEKMVEKKDAALEVILGYCSDAGVSGSILREQPAAADEPPKPLALYRCRICSAYWLFWGGTIAPFKAGTYNLLDQHQKPGPCCDNATMGEQIEFVRDIIARPKRVEAPASAPAQGEPLPNDPGWIDYVIQRTADLPDRTSPPDWPEAMLITEDELRTILREVVPTSRGDE